MPVLTINGEIDDETGREAGFASEVTAEQAAAAEAAATAAATLHLSLARATLGEEPRPKSFTVTEGAGEPIAASLADYRLQSQVLGEGAFGKVKLAKSDVTGHVVAVKVIKRDRINARAEELLRREVKHHERLRHPNIVRLYTWIKSPAKYYLVMECCGEGDLLKHLNEAGMLQDGAARGFFKGMMHGLAFCHGLGLHHRDIKLENLMLCKGADGALTVKLADFGLSDLRVLPSDLSGTFCGSPLYAAPELMTAGACPDGYDASRSDIWSCGVVLYALLASCLPFDADDLQALVRMIQKGTPSAPVPRARGADASALVLSMMQVDPNARPSAAEVLAHPWSTVDTSRSAIKEAATVGTTLTMPSPASTTLGASGLDDAVDVGIEPPSPAHRRGASETTAFFKSMLAKEATREAASEIGRAHV